VTLGNIIRILILVGHAVALFEISDVGALPA
jgi:hypothetical protein